MRRYTNWISTKGLVLSDSSSNPIVENQFPLCAVCHEKGWPYKSFTFIAKRTYAKRAKIKNDGGEADEDEDVIEEIETRDDNDDDNDDNDEMNGHVNDEDIENVNELESNTLQDHNLAGIIVSGSKKRNQRNQKTAAKNLVSTSNIDFLNMHGTGEFSSLPCNDIRYK